ncbi:glycosyltransferase family 25 protein [Bradyrhizobium sp. CB1650]|uniref:glycosyltransferase family 25 protein n=1 Tax=Bradyrhizobium sp. CB1650 TaxID=3039153 RepID=UPI002435EC14|nr:glycosyltransferase family 25 protein [Bradyrhizobium sp. CB1650]WGD50662.1 glycosyltransferase family 25 protein [Bradyrhizobium sp. CB1650]
MGSNLRIVAISLADSPRRERAAANLDSLDIPWTFFDALRVPADGLPQYDEALAVRFWGRGLSRAEIGCAASHMSVMAKLAASESDASWTLVVEDDVVLDAGFSFRSLPDICKAADIGYLRLYGRHMAPCRHVAWLDQRELVRFERAPMGTQAYLISSRAAGRFIDSVTTIHRPVDWEMDRFWANGLYNYALFPFPCLELTLASSIAKAAESVREPTAIDRAAWFAWKSKEYVLRLSENIRLGRSDRRIRARLAGVASVQGSIPETIRTIEGV